MARKKKEQEKELTSKEKAIIEREKFIQARIKGGK